MKHKIILCVCILMLTTLLTGCFEKEPTVQETTLEITLAATTAEELAELDQYINLQKADLRGSTCYDAVMAYMEAHPQVQVTYDVTIGGVVWPQDTRNLTLADGSYTVEDLCELISYLPDVTSVSLPMTTLDSDTLFGLSETLANIDLS